MHNLCRDRSFVAVCLLTLELLAIGDSALAQSCQTFSGLTYGTYVDSAGQTQDLQLELMVPSGAASPAPVVIWVHGGGWSTGSRLPIPSRVSALCSRGYAVASVDYRLSNVARWPAQIQDCRGAVRWLRAHAAEYDLDPNRFAAWGESAGGHLAVMLGTAGGVSASTVGNVTLDLEGSTGGNLAYSSRVQAVVDWYGATSPLDPARWASPDDPPFLIMHGSADSVVPLATSEALHAALTAAGTSATLVLVPNAVHGGGAWDDPAVLTRVDGFFDALLRQGRRRPSGR